MGSLVTKDEVRKCFTPALSVEDITDDQLEMRIDMVEDYIKAVYFNDQMPKQEQAKYPTLLIVLSKIVKRPNLLAKHGIIESVSIGDFKYTLSIAGKGTHKTAYEVARSWEDMALEILKARGNAWFFKKVNDDYYNNDYY